MAEGRNDGQHQQQFPGQCYQMQEVDQYGNNLQPLLNASTTQPEQPIGFAPINQGQDDASRHSQQGLPDGNQDVLYYPNNDFNLYPHDDPIYSNSGYSSSVPTEESQGESWNHTDNEHTDTDAIHSPSSFGAGELGNNAQFPPGYAEIPAVQGAGSIFYQQSQISQSEGYDSQSSFHLPPHNVPDPQAWQSKDEQYYPANAGTNVPKRPMQPYDGVTEYSMSQGQDGQLAQGIGNRPGYEPSPKRSMMTDRGVNILPHTFSSADQFAYDMPGTSRSSNQPTIQDQFPPTQNNVYQNQGARSIYFQQSQFSQGNSQISYPHPPPQHAPYFPQARQSRASQNYAASAEQNVHKRSMGSNEGINHCSTSHGQFVQLAQGIGNRSGCEPSPKRSMITGRGVNDLPHTFSSADQLASYMCGTSRSSNQPMIQSRVPPTQNLFPYQGARSNDFQQSQISQSHNQGYSQSSFPHPPAQHAPYVPQARQSQASQYYGASAEQNEISVRKRSMGSNEGINHSSTSHGQFGQLAQGIGNRSGYEQSPKRRMMTDRGVNNLPHTFSSADQLASYMRGTSGSSNQATIQGQVLATQNVYPNQGAGCMLLQKMPLQQPLQQGPSHPEAKVASYMPGTSSSSNQPTIQGQVPPTQNVFPNQDAGAGSMLLQEMPIQQPLQQGSYNPKMKELVRAAAAQPPEHSSGSGSQIYVKIEKEDGECPVNGCPFTANSSDLLKSLRQHIRYCHPNYKKCLLNCHYFFNVKTKGGKIAQYHHRKGIHPERIKCQVCGILFASRLTYTRHWRNAHENKTS